MICLFKEERFKRFFILALGVVFFMGSLLYYSGELKPEVTHPDEVFRVRMAVYFKLFFIDRDLDNPLWQKREIYLASPGSAYLAGLALWLGGQQDKMGEEGLDDWWNFKESSAWNLSHTKLPSAKELYILKFTMALFISLSCIAIYWICLKCFGAVTAFFSSLLFVFHPAILECATKATFDAPLIFFIILNILWMLFFYEHFLKKRYSLSLFFAAMIGLNTAVSFLIKLQGVIAGVIFLVFCFCIIVGETAKHFKASASQSKDSASWINRIRVILASMILFGVVAATCSILPNPCLHGRPIDGLKKMAKLRAEQINIQIKEFSTQNYFHQSYSASIIDSFPQKVRYVLFGPFMNSGRGALSFLLKFSLFVFGFISVVQAEVRFIRKNASSSFNTIILLWFAVLFVAITAIIYIRFEKYYITLIAPISIFMAFAIENILDKAINLLAGRVHLFKKL